MKIPQNMLGMRLNPPPGPAQEEAQWRIWLARRIISFVLWLALGAMLLALLGRPLVLRPVQLTYGAPLWPLAAAHALVAAVSLWALHRLDAARTSGAVLAWILALWAYGFAIMLVNGAVPSVMVVGMMLLMTASGLLLDHRQFLWRAALGILTALALMALDLWGPVKISERTAEPPVFWATTIGGMLLLVAMLQLYNRTIHYSMERTRHELDERRQVEAALRLSQDRYRNFIERTYEGVWLLEFAASLPLDTPPLQIVEEMLAHARMADCNEAAARQLGISNRSEMLGIPMRRFLGNVPVERIVFQMERIAQSGFMGDEIEMHFNGPGGPHDFVVSITGVVAPGPDGAPALHGLWGSQRDVTKRRQAEQALKARNEQLATLHRIGMSISTHKDLESVLLEALERLRETLPLDMFMVALLESGGERPIFRLALIYDAGRFWPTPTTTIKPNDWLYPVYSERRALIWLRTPAELAEIAADPVHRRIGDIAQISASLLAAPLQVGSRLIGITSIQSYTPNAYTPEHLEFLSLASLQLAIAVDNARLYEDLQRLNAELEQRVSERTAGMEKAMQELESFSYSVSHDLRAPLRAIDGYSRFLLDDYSDRLDDEGVTFLNNVRKSAQRMGALIDDLLNLSRVARTELRHESVSLSEMAEEILARLRDDQPERNVETSVQPGLTVTGDTELLRLALQNLLENAWKFTSKNDAAGAAPAPARIEFGAAAGGASTPARIEFGAADRHGERVYYVRDNGAGFDMRYSGNLFKAFSRLHGVDDFEGTGIGLASVKRIIERHGGRVWAESAPNEGAVFYFTLRE